MKHQFATRKWKRMLSAGLSLAMTFSLLPSIPARAELSDAAKTPPNPDKACSIPLPSDGSTVTGNLPFPEGAAGSSIFRIPAMITMDNGELLSIADIRYTQRTDGNGIDTMASISSDSGETWEYCFPFFFPDSYQDALRQSTSFIDPGLLEGPDGTIYCIADAFPTEFSVQNIAARTGTGYVDINGTQRLALTDNYSNVSTAPTDENDTKYLYYVDEFRDGYARILKREDNLPTDYAVDEWYNLYSVDEDGAYHADLKQTQVNVVNDEEKEIQQNVYYKDSLFHVYQTGYLWVITSKDHGRTWEHPRDIIPEVKTDEDRTLLVSPGRGLTTSDGTLVIGLYRFNGSADSQRASLMYSSDNGATWHRSDSIETGGWSSENEIVELEDGTLRMFYRGGGGGKISYADFTKNENGGYDVGKCVDVNGCSVHSDCNVTAISYSKKINGKQAILLACPGGSGRSHGKIFTFLVNDDKTLSLHHTFDVPESETYYAYSSLTELWDGSIGLLWEDGPYSDIIQFDKFDIAELTAANASLENPDGSKSSAVSIHVAKGETSDKVYPAKEGEEIGENFISTPPNASVATAKAEKRTDLSVQMPVYSHLQNSSSLADAFGTDVSPTETLELTDAEFTFTKTGNDSYQIKNEATNQWMTIAPAATEYFSSTAGDVVVTPQSDGTVQIHCTSTADKGVTGYALFFTDHCNWNRADNTNNSSYICNLTLWERAENASDDSKIPGYRKASISADSIESGKSYLITANYNDNIILLYPQNGASNQPKLLAIKHTATAKVYAHAGNNSSLDAAFATATAQPYTIDLANAEFTFTKKDNNYQIKNEATNQWMTMFTGADSYFETTARDVTVAPQDDGTVQIYCTGTNQGTDKRGYALFYTTQCNWNRADTTSNANYICNLTLWERSEDAPEDSRIPGYKEANINSADDTNGKSYLITAKYNDNIILLYPQNGESNQPKLLATEIKPTETSVKVYNHSTSNSDLNTAFATATAQQKIIDLAKAEYTFTKNGDNYQIKNEATSQWMTIAPAATEYFSSTAGDVVVTPQSDGTVQIHCTSTADKQQTGYAVFYINNNCNWNRTTANTDTNGIYNLTLWERSASAPKDSKLPGYQEAAISADNITDGKSYLITAKYNDNIILLYPQNGVSNQPKLIVGPLDASDEEEKEPVVIPDPTISQKTDIVVSITGVNKGFTKAVIDGAQYRIYVTDDTVTYPANEPIDVPYLYSYQANGEDTDVADVADMPNAKLAMYDYVSAKANSAATFSKTANADLDIADAEFTFTQDTANAGKWIIQSGDKYMVQISGGILFSNESRPMTVIQTEGADTFHIYNHAENTNGRYVMFVKSKMYFDATGGVESNADYEYELTFWKKDASATDSLLPGYKKVTAGEGIENNGVYLVSYVFQENGKEYAVLVYPKDTNSNSSAAAKLARIDTMLRITPKTGGQFRVTIDGKEYAYDFADPNCKHEENTHPVSGYVEADCETAGYTGDTVCGLCGQMIQAGTVAPAAKHNWSGSSLQALTETQNGITVQICGNSPMHQRKTIVYASAYKRLKEAFGNAPEEISDSKKALYKETDVAALKAAYDAGVAVSQKTAAEQTNKEMYGSIDALAAAGKQLHDHRDALEAEFTWTLAKAAPIYTEGKQESHSQASWDAFSSAFTNANKPENIQKSFTNLQAIVTDLKTAFSSLNQEAAKGALTALYNQYKDMQKGDYSDSTWSVFTKALENAKDVLENTSASMTEMIHAREALEKAFEELRTKADETVKVPEQIVYTPPTEGQYPKAAVVLADRSNSSHTRHISDWTEETSTLTENNPDVKTEIVYKDGIWGFNGQLKSDHAKYNIAGENKVMAMTFKLWLNKLQTDKQVEILAKGQQYSLQLKNSALTLWMYSGSSSIYPTVTYGLNDSEHIGKWLDVMLIISGNHHQTIYVNGKCSDDNTNQPVLSSTSDPFSIGYRAGGDGYPFTSDIGYFADIKFYDCGTQDVSDGKTKDYDAIVSLLNAKTPTAAISADAYDTKTLWSLVAEDQTETSMDPADQFAADTVYKATTTFTAHDYFLFSDTEEFCTAVAEATETDRSNASVKVLVPDNKTMTVEITYPPQTPLDSAKDAVKHALKAAESIYEKGQGCYSDETWKAFKEAYEAALEAPEDADADTLNQLAEDLENARTALTASAEKAKELLDAAVAAADAIYQAGQEIYTDESWIAFQTAYEAAKNAPANASAEDLQKLANDLDAAQKALVLDRNGVIENASSSVTTAADKINNIGQGTYSTESWNAYVGAYHALKEELEKGDEADTVKLNELKKALDQAEANLTTDTDWVNAKNALTKALNDASAIYAGGKKTYTDASWNAFVTAYQNADAKKNASITDSTAKALNDLAAALNQARAALTTGNTDISKPATSIEKGGVRYVITNAAKKTVAAEKGLNKKTLKKVVIPSTVTIDKVTYKVTEIKAKAFQNFTKINSVTIGANVTKIGNQSFSGCKKLKTLVFKGKKVPTFVSKPFKKTPSKITVKLAKGMTSKVKKKMKSKLIKAGISKKAKIK